MTTNEAALKLARKIAVDRPGLNALQKQAILDGRWDDVDGVRCALAAILEVTKRAAGLAEVRRKCFVSGPDVRCYVNMASPEIATALRNGDHLS